MNICEWTHVTLEGTKEARLHTLELFRASLSSVLKVGTFDLLDDARWEEIQTMRDAVEKLDKLISELEGEVKYGKG